MFDLFGKRIEFSDDIMNFAECYGVYLGLWNRADRQFCKIYDEYGMFRFMIEFFRGDTVRGIFLGLSTAQWISFLILIYYFNVSILHIFTMVFSNKM